MIVFVALGAPFSYLQRVGEHKEDVNIQGRRKLEA
jgi:hypothetical protein